jgi:uncharacterized membrane protein
MRSAQFFASTTLLIIGGLLAALGRPEQAVAVLRRLPIAEMTMPLLETSRSCCCSACSSTASSSSPGRSGNTTN